MNKLFHGLGRWFQNKGQQIRFGYVGPVKCQLK